MGHKRKRHDPLIYQFCCSEEGIVVVVVVGIRPGDIFICWHGDRLPFPFVMVNDGKLHSPRRTDNFVVICVEESPENT